MASYPAELPLPPTLILLCWLHPKISRVSSNLELATLGWPIWLPGPSGQGRGWGKWGCHIQAGILLEIWGPARGQQGTTVPFQSVHLLPCCGSQDLCCNAGGGIPSAPLEVGIPSCPGPSALQTSPLGSPLLAGPARESLRVPGQSTGGGS